ncbi:S8 family peptidase [Clostridium tarantellae]|uniref:S8 family serine peptidase n=1 Tax=Clostridium tarantellae TaxID=39493 RepID=A0A6I1MV64_9CLOT|nr:S8 family peptidase [Clostridium tarantellae]MPQ44741.1 S8 family serine peptidase [Clostridium tarantellae]
MGFAKYNKEGYISYLIEYTPGIKDEIVNIDNVFFEEINDIYGIITLDEKINLNSLKDVENIALFDVGGIYTLDGSNPIEATEAYSFHESDLLNLEGRGILIGTIDTGIDYLSKEFMREDETTRIVSIWDQNLEKDPEQDIFYGKIFTEDNINKAIEANKKGENPYDIVPTKDEIGHGTMMAGIIGGRGVDRDLKGVAPDCMFSVVKLREAKKNYCNLLYVKGDSPKFRDIDLLTGMIYLKNLSKKLRMPLVIYLPLGTNWGGHDGRSILERYINFISDKKGDVVVTSTGNEGISQTHTSGFLKNIYDFETIELNIGQGQESIAMEIYITRPQGAILTIISPAGEAVEYITAKLTVTAGLEEGLKIKFLYENTIMYIKYYSPDQLTGDERIVIKAENIKAGIWIFNLKGTSKIYSRYDAWILQKELLDKDTKFINATPNTTLNMPGTCETVITTSYYNQNKNSIVSEAGRGYARDGIVKPIITAPGINALVAMPGGEKTTISGGSVAAAIVTGICALLLQWGIVDKNNKSMYAVSLEMYLIKGAKRIEGLTYPNDTWGYGIVNVKGIFESIRKEENINTFKIYEEYIGDILIRNPYRLYYKKEK